MAYKINSFMDDDKSGFIEVSMMLEILKTRFLEHRNLHPGLEWSEVEHRLREAPTAIAVLQKMEESGGEIGRAHV